MNFTFSQERLRIQQNVKQVCEREIAPGAAELDQASPQASVDMIRERLATLARAGVLGLGFPEEVGGSGADLFGPVFLLQELAAVCPSTALSVLSSVGLAARALHEWGPADAKGKELADLLGGRSVGAYGSLEPGAGLDSWTLQTTATARRHGFSLTGRKLMVPNAPVKGGIKVFPATDGNAAGLFLVAPGEAGMEISPPQAKMGCRGGPTGDVTLTDCPAVKLAAGDGSRPAESIRCHEHLLFAAMAEGMIHGSLIAAGMHARDHLAGGKPLGRHQEISFKLADSMLFQETARMLIYRCVWLLEQKDPQAPMLASAAKAFAAESAVKAANHAVQIFGQEGVCAGNRAERFYRDSRLMEILGDPTEKHRMFLADRVLQEY